MFILPKRIIRRVFIHCSASDRPEHDDVKVMREWHLARGFNDVGYHFFIKKNGALQTGRPIELVPAAQQGHNTGTIAICLHGLVAANFTLEQFATLKKLCREINDAALKAFRPITFHGHREVAAKECPVFDYRSVIGLTKDGFLIGQ